MRPKLRGTLKTSKIKARDEEVRGVLMNVRRRIDEERNAEIRRLQRHSLS